MFQHNDQIDLLPEDTQDDNSDTSEMSTEISVNEKFGYDDCLTSMLSPTMDKENDEAVWEAVLDIVAE